MFIKFASIFTVISGFIIFGAEERLSPRELPLYKFNELVNFWRHSTYYCSDKKDGKFSCFSISQNSENMLVVDVDGSDYFFGFHDLTGKVHELKLNYYTGNIKIWSSYDSRKDLMTNTSKGHVIWKDKTGKIVSYKKISKDRMPAYYK